MKRQSWRFKCGNFFFVEFTFKPSKWFRRKLWQFLIRSQIACAIWTLWWSLMNQNRTTPENTVHKTCLLFFRSFIRYNFHDKTLKRASLRAPTSSIYMSMWKGNYVIVRWHASFALKSCSIRPELFVIVVSRLPFYRRCNMKMIDGREHMRLFLRRRW